MNTDLRANNLKADLVSLGVEQTTHDGTLRTLAKSIETSPINSGAQLEVKRAIDAYTGSDSDRVDDFLNWVHSNSRKQSSELEPDTSEPQSMFVCSGCGAALELEAIHTCGCPDSVGGQILTECTRCNSLFDTTEKASSSLICEYCQNEKAILPTGLSE